MSFSEYTGSKPKVSHTVTRILRNAQENLPRIQSAQCGSVGALLKSFSNGGSNKTGSERLNKPTSPQSSKFGFQKLRLGLEKKRTNCNHHQAELLDNQDGEDEDQESGDDETDMNHHFSSNNRFHNASLIGPPKSQDPPMNPKQKRWMF